MSRPVIPVSTVAAHTAAADSGPQARLEAPPPLSLYVHFPWCVRKCPYCDFNSHALQQDAPAEQAWLEAVIADLQQALPQVWGRRVHSVFIGGGTPSLMSSATVDRLLTSLRTLLPIDALAEITLEANPGSVEAERFRDFRDAGVNRLSLGIQSFDDRMLAAIGRVHDAAQAHRAGEIAQRHFDRVNLDLMYALPAQTPAMAFLDVDTALQFAPAHLSCYHLTLEPNTPFARQPPPLPDDDSAADMQEGIETRLAAAGYHHYETSAFARPNGECLHNLNYWTFGDYLGIGPGAHSKLSSHEAIRREVRHMHPKRYLEGARSGDFIHHRHAVSATELPFEFMMNALRLNDGVAAGLLTARTGIALGAISTQLLAAQRKGLLEIDGEQLRPSARGRRFLNDLLQCFL